MQKSISILMVALLATGMSLTAQNRGNGAPGEGAKMGNPAMGMLKDLNLTENQKAKLKVLHQGFAVQDSVSREQFKKQRQAVQAERHLAMAKILTPEQLAQLDKIQVEKEQKAAGKNGQFGPGNRGQGFRQGGFAGQVRGRMMVMRGRMMQQGRGQMMRQGRGQMPVMRGRMMQQRVQMNRRMQMRIGQAPFNKKDAKVFKNQENRMNAGPRVNPEIRIKNQVENMTKQLDLTPGQTAKIQAIQTKHAKKEIEAYQELQNKHDAQLKDRTAKFDEIKAVLTPDQVKKLDAQKEKAPKMQRNAGPMQDKK